MYPYSEGVGIPRQSTVAIDNLDHVAWLVEAGTAAGSGQTHPRTGDRLLNLCDALVDYLIATQR